jgi:hypothetical protein
VLELSKSWNEKFSTALFGFSKAQRARQ